MNNFIPYGTSNNMGIPQIDPYQDKVSRFNNLQQMQNITPQSKSNTNMNFVVVENLQKAKEQVVPCGYTMWMRDSSEPYQYIKSVDSIGTPTFTILRVEDVTNRILSNSIQQDLQSVQYVSIEQYNQLKDTVEQLKSTINSYSNILNKTMETSKNTEVKPVNTNKAGGK